MATRQLILDVDNSAIHTELIVKGEIDSRFLEINFVQGNTYYNLTNDRVLIDMVFPDNSTLSTELTIINENNGLVLMPLTSQMSTQLGSIDCVINIKDSATLSTKLSIVTLKIIVINNTDTSIIESTTQFTALENLIIEAGQYSNKIGEVQVNGVTLVQDANHAVNVLSATPEQGTKADNALPASSYTANNTLAQLLTVDTDSSGLNATTLQGNAPSAFATAAQGILADSAVQNTFILNSHALSGTSLNLSASDVGALSNVAPTITALTLGYDCDALANAYVPAYYKDAMGYVCLRGGFTRNRSAYSGMLATLPAGFRTSKQIGIAISGGHSITIMTNGQIYPTTPQGSSDYLDGVRFLADS